MKRVCDFLKKAEVYYLARTSAMAQGSKALGRSHRDWHK